MRLSHRDFDLFQRTLVELYAYRDLTEFRSAVPGLFLKLIPGEHFGLITYGLDPRTGAARMIDRIESEVRLRPEVIPYWETHLLEHPFTQYFRGGGEPTALMFSDFFTLRQLKNSQYWEFVCKVMEYDHLIAIPVGNSAGGSAAAVGRRGKDFTERDRFVLNLLRPHFNRAQKNAELTTAEHGDLEGPTLSEFGLLPRESEVAHWVGQGKTNSEIATILQISPRTIEKHMERILTKLGVENRATAAVVISRAGNHEATNHASFPLRL